MHEEKEEVYIVTHIDSKHGQMGLIRGTGSIRSLEVLRSDQQFRAEYLSSVQEYEAIRQKVDSGLDVSHTIEERAKLNGRVHLDKRIKAR